jgi:hypothetical protein
MKDDLKFWGGLFFAILAACVGAALVFGVTLRVFLWVMDGAGPRGWVIILFIVAVWAVAEIVRLLTNAQKN